MQMKNRYRTALICCLCLLLTACGSTSTSQTQIPKDVSEFYIMGFTEAPLEVFTQPAAKNGLAGSLYYADGRFESSNGSTYFNTENGRILVLNPYKYEQWETRFDAGFCRLYFLYDSVSHRANIPDGHFLGYLNAEEQDNSLIASIANRGKRVMATATPSPSPISEPGAPEVTPDSVDPTPRPTIRPTATPVPTPESKIVYITNTGKRYHTATCRHTRKSKIEITESEAKDRGYTPCQVCNP